MRNSNWVEILPPRPPAADADVISRSFFKPVPKTGELKFKTGKCQVFFHVPTELYDMMEEHREQKEYDRKVCVFFFTLSRPISTLGTLDTASER